MAEKIKSHKDLRVYQSALDTAIRIFFISKDFPKEEKYSLTDQIRRSSRSVAANIAEAWRKRRYKAAFIAKLNDAEGEACETQVWLEISLRCKYIEIQVFTDLEKIYNQILGQLVLMIESPQKWTIQ